MARKSDEEKLVEQIHKALDNYWFNIPLFASLLIDENNYYNNKIAEMIIHISDYMAVQYIKAWEHGAVSEGLTIGAYVKEMLDLKKLEE
jgi:hypothetical protein